MKADLDLGRASHRAWVRRAFAPHLAAHDSAAGERMFHALAAATDLHMWQIPRRDRGLDRPAAERIVRDLVGGLIGREREEGEISVAESVGPRKPGRRSGPGAGADRAGA